MEINKFKIKNELKRLLRFTCTGIVSAAVDCGVYYLLLNFADINFRLIQPISMSIGLCCSFIVNRELVFRREKSSLGKEALKYLVVCLICILISPVIISFYCMIFDEYVGKIPATLTTGFLNYLLNRFFVYKNHRFFLSSDKNKRGNENSWNFIS